MQVRPLCCRSFQVTLLKYTFNSLSTDFQTTNIGRQITNLPYYSCIKSSSHNNHVNIIVHINQISNTSTLGSVYWGPNYKFSNHYIHAINRLGIITMLIYYY